MHCARAARDFFQVFQQLIALDSLYLSLTLHTLALTRYTQLIQCIFICTTSG
jgi:hypothetical protein